MGTQTFAPAIAIRSPGDTIVGKQITAVVRINAHLVVLELADGSQLQFRVKDGALEVGSYVERPH